MIKFIANSFAEMSLNKEISNLLGILLTLAHLLFFIVIFDISRNAISNDIRIFIPDVFLQDSNRTGLVVILVIGYILTMGTICTLLVIKQYLKEIRDNLKLLNQTSEWILTKTK